MFDLLVWLFLLSPWFIVAGVLWRSAADRVRRQRERGKPLVQFRLGTLLIYCSLIQAFLAILCYLAGTTYDEHATAIDLLCASWFVVVLAFLGWTAIGDRRHGLARRLAKRDGRAIGPPQQATAANPDRQTDGDEPQAAKEGDGEHRPEAWWRHRFATARPIVSAWSLIQNPPTRN